MHHVLTGQRSWRKRILQLIELDKFRLGAYENAKLYKERTKRWHDKHIKGKEFEVERQLRSGWSGPFTVVAVYPYGTVEVVTQDQQRRFKVNGQRLKAYWGGDYSHEKTILPLEDPK
ncbi:uncharacterized protein LOC111398168 [Olea europaea var. sylvestris]|uniref:uncharacterized protein LOC111398168 n=1 Tax=Olea europaea var. sylvestris TaxID=158386 RepID=UPI000C1D2BA8|nr:uncharacterized protein LOC111398168 [Olea europaea var. sylvestris]